MEQKLIKITLQQHERPDKKIGVLTNVVIHDVLPDRTEVPVKYQSTYEVRDKPIKNLDIKKSA